MIEVSVANDDENAPTGFDAITEPKSAHVRDEIAQLQLTYAKRLREKFRPTQPYEVELARNTLTSWNRKLRLAEEAAYALAYQRISEAREELLFGSVTHALALVKKMKEEMK